MYEAVTPHPVGRSTTARFAHTAGRYGFEGVVVRARHGSSRHDTASDDASAPDYATVREASGVDVVDGIEIVADDPERASGPLSQARRDHTLVLVRGGTPRLNRFAVEQSRVDVLTRPLSRGGEVDHVIARAAHDNAVRIEIDLGPVLRLDGGARVQALRKLRTLRTVVEHYDAPFVVSATPDSHLQMRAPRELRAVGEAVGFAPETIETGLREWGRIASRNRERRSEEFIGPGVKRGRYEKEPR
jgi:ribonuclease P/MRP protein subunit RPP1